MCNMLLLIKEGIKYNEKTCMDDDDVLNIV